MNEVKIEKLIKKIEGTLDQSRYQHTIGVMYTAGAMAMRYQADLDSALIAGLLHDCAKGYSSEKKIKLCEKHHLGISQAERKNPGLLHAKLGSYLAKEKYGITDPDILHAIQYHTTGCPDMNLMDKIIYIADYIEPNRNEAPNLDKIRYLAFTDIDECLYTILKDSLAYLKKKDEVIDPMTEETYLYYKTLFHKSEEE